jgi:hypothetical protein
METENTHVLMPKMLEQFHLSIGALGQDGGAEGLHYLLDRDRLTGQLVSR